MLFTYQTLTQDDYNAFLNSYVVSKEWWAPQDFGKPNIERLQLVSRDWHPKLENIWISENVDALPNLFSPLGTIEEAIAPLLDIPGIGEWTAQYIALRAIRETDASHFRRRLTSRHRKGRWRTGNAGQTPPTSGDVAAPASLCGATFVVCRFGRSSECCVSNQLKSRSMKDVSRKDHQSRSV